MSESAPESSSEPTSALPTQDNTKTTVEPQDTVDAEPLPSPVPGVSETDVTTANPPNGTPPREPWERRVAYGALLLSFVATVIGAYQGCLTREAVVAGQQQVKAAQEQLLLNQAQLKATQDQLALNQAQLDATDRAWLKADVQIAGPLRRQADNWTVPLVLTLRNIGKTPATDIESRVVTRASEWGDRVFTGPTSHQAEMCNGMRKNRLARRDKGSELWAGSVLFPEDEHSSGVNTALSETQARAASRTYPKELGDDAVTLVVVGCVAYQSGTGSTPRETGFVYLLTYEPDVEGHARVFHLNAMPTNPAHLRLRQSIFGGNYAR